MSVSAQITPPKLTAEEYSKLSEVVGYKDELIEGERVLAPMAKFSHTVVLDNLEALLKKQFPEMRVVREAGWRFANEEGVESVPGPDLMVLRPEDYDKAARSGEYFEGQPLFVVEVISPTERKSRRMQKVGLYLEAGAVSVVEVDYKKQHIFVYRPDEDTAEVIRDHIIYPFEAEIRNLLTSA